MRRAQVLLTSALLWATCSASAGIWENFYRGLDILSTPSGNPVVQTTDGTRVNGARSGRVRIVPNGVVGKGYRVEFDRSFGVDTSGRPEVFRFAGLGEITLSGATQVTAGYTRPIKGLYFGESSFTVNNLNYDMQAGAGFQNARLTGTLNATGVVNANMLGFYEVTLNVSNTNSQFTVDGALANDETNTNFDIGPISLKGNLFVDLVSGLLANAGIEATDLQDLFPGSPSPWLDSLAPVAIQESAANENLDDRSRVTSLLLRTVLAQDQAAASELIETLVASEGAALDLGDEAAQAAPQAIPEAGTLTLLMTGGTLVMTRRRR